MASLPPPNYVNPQTRVAPLVGLAALGLTIMISFVVARIYIRYLRAVFWADDWIIVAAAISSIVSTSLGLSSVRYGLGYHIWDLKPGWLAAYMKFSIPNNIIFNLCVTLPKISLCFTYLRLFLSRKNAWFCYIIIGVLSSWLFSITIVSIFACRPVRSFWDSSIPRDYCIDSYAFYFTNAFINSITDFLVYLWPVPTLWQMNLPRNQRLWIVFVFALGSIVCFAGAIRIRFMYKVFHTDDLLYDSALVGMASSVEVNVGIAFSCIHAMKPIMAKLFPGMFTAASPHAVDRIPDQLINEASDSSNGVVGAVFMRRLDLKRLPEH